MKKQFTILIFSIPISLIILAFAQGPSAGYTGSPLDGETCAVCHTSTVQAANIIEIVGLPAEGYVPGDTYTVKITDGGNTAPRYGFQVTSETNAAKTGTWIITDAARTQLAGTTAVTHTFDGTTPVGTPITWTMEWTAPVAGTGDVHFYASLNAANNNSMSSGDQIYAGSYTVSETNVGIVENQLQTQVEVYPNPATTQMNITLPVNSEIRIFDNNGREVIHRISSNQTESIDVSSLVNGMYFVHVSHDGQSASRSIVKR